MREHVVAVNENGDVEKKVVELVRCIDCKFYEPFRKDDGFCKISSMLHEHDWFCADGERKEQDNG